MSKGLQEYNSTNPIFKSALMPRLFLTVGLTSLWYAVAKQTRVLGCPKLNQYSIPVAFLLSFCFSKGITNQYIAFKVNKNKLQAERNRNLYNHKLAERKRIEQQI